MRIKIRGTWRRTCTHAMHFYVNGVGHIFRVVTTTAARVHIIFNCSKLKRANALLLSLEQAGGSQFIVH